MCHVLIIEDEALVALHLETILADYGATSFSFAETEAEAVRQARRRLPASSRRT
jgi:CheY-like chemotaxis protein